MSSITRFLPKNHISYIVGIITHLPLPKVIWTPIITLFAQAYKINLDEAEFPISEYSSLGEFFIRKLKQGRRPIAKSWAVHPADAVISQAANIQLGQLIQAKGKKYHVNDLLQDPKAFEVYDQGYFLTYYLCPTDYHRVHSPVDGVVQKITHIPGTLWPVNRWSTENIHELFTVNERMCVEIKTEKGLVNVVFVGATNVGQIELSIKKGFLGNQLTLSKTRTEDQLNIPVQKGQELGYFRMGSTVVMVYQKGVLENPRIDERAGQPVQVNSEFC